MGFSASILYFVLYMIPFPLRLLCWATAVQKSFNRNEQKIKLANDFTQNVEQSVTSGNAKQIVIQRSKYIA